MFSFLLLCSTISQMKTTSDCQENNKTGHSLSTPPAAGVMCTHVLFCQGCAFKCTPQLSILFLVSVWKVSHGDQGVSLNTHIVPPTHKTCHHQLKQCRIMFRFWLLLFQQCTFQHVKKIILTLPKKLFVALKKSF